MSNVVLLVAVRWCSVLAVFLVCTVALPHVAHAQADVIRVPVIATRQMRDVRVLRLVRDTITLRQSDTLDLGTVGVLGVSESGDTLGAVMLFDYRAHPDTLRMLGDRRIVATRAGTAGVTLQVPEIFWRRRDLQRPSVRLVIVVTASVPPD